MQDSFQYNCITPGREQTDKAQEKIVKKQWMKSSGI